MDRTQQLTPITPLVLAAALALIGATGAAAQAGGSWLDGPPRAFHSPGAATPGADYRAPTSSSARFSSALMYPIV